MPRPYPEMIAALQHPPAPPSDPSPLSSHDGVRPPPGWPSPHEISRYLQAASESLRPPTPGVTAIAVVCYVETWGNLGPVYDLTLMHGGQLETLIVLRQLASPDEVWALLEDIAQACPRCVPRPPAPSGSMRSTHRALPTIVPVPPSPRPPMPTLPSEE